MATIRVDEAWLNQRTPPYVFDEKGATYDIQTPINTPGSGIILNAEDMTIKGNQHALTFDNTPRIDIPNYSFEDGLSGWTPQAGAPILVYQHLPPNGNPRVAEGSHSLGCDISKMRPGDRWAVKSASTFTLRKGTKWHLGGFGWLPWLFKDETEPRFYIRLRFADYVCQLYGVHYRPPFMLTQSGRDGHYGVPIDLLEAPNDLTAELIIEFECVAPLNLGNNTEKFAYFDCPSLTSSWLNGITGAGNVPWDAAPGQRLSSKGLTVEDLVIVQGAGHCVGGRGVSRCGEGSRWQHCYIDQNGIVDTIGFDANYGNNLTLEQLTMTSATRWMRSRDSNTSNSLAITNSTGCKVVESSFHSKPGVGIAASSAKEFYIADNAFTGIAYYTNAFSVFAYKPTDGIIEHNVITKHANGQCGRGIFIGSNAYASDCIENEVHVQELPQNAEYGGAVTGGAYALQIESQNSDSPPILIERNKLHVYANEVEGAALRINQGSPGPLVIRDNELHAVSKRSDLMARAMFVDTWHPDLYELDGTNKVFGNSVFYMGRSQKRPDDPNETYIPKPAVLPGIEFNLEGDKKLLVRGLVQEYPENRQTCIHLEDPVFQEKRWRDAIVETAYGYMRQSGANSRDTEFWLFWTTSIQVVDYRTGESIAGARVTLRGIEQITDSEGCTYFEQHESRSWTDWERKFHVVLTDASSLKVEADGYSTFESELPAPTQSRPVRVELEKSGVEPPEPPEPPEPGENFIVEGAVVLGPFGIHGPDDERVVFKVPIPFRGMFKIRPATEDDLDPNDG